MQETSPAPQRLFDATGFFRAMDETKTLLVRREDVTWHERHHTPNGPVDVLLAFGCAVQHTPHLMLEAIAVFDALGIDFQAVTGRQFCCGRPFQRIGKDQVTADRISAKSYERFLEYEPRVAVQWCGACMLQYLEVISAQAEAPFEVVHVTKFIADLLRSRGDSIPWRTDISARVVLHTHSQFLPQQDLDARMIKDILGMVPGVELVGQIDPPSIGAPCDLAGPVALSVLTDISSTEYAQAQAELLDQASRVHADTLVTPYHKCQMEWSKFSSEGLVVREWMSLLAEALGVNQPDRYAEYWQLADPIEVAKRAEPQWASWGLSKSDAIDCATRHFVPSFAAKVHRCDCGGQGCGAPAS